MTQYDIAEFLRQMREAAATACSYIEGMNKEEFFNDSRTRHAVILNLIILGEVAAKLMARRPGFVGANADWPWQNMRAMRNRIAHGISTSTLMSSGQR